MKTEKTQTKPMPQNLTEIGQNIVKNTHYKNINEILDFPNMSNSKEEAPKQEMKKIRYLTWTIHSFISNIAIELKETKFCIMMNMNSNEEYIKV